MNCKEDHNMQELIRCCLGGVTIEVMAPKELHEDLSVFYRRTTDFLTNKPVDLRMCILKPKLLTPNNDYSHRDEFAKPFILNRVQIGTIKEKQERLFKAEQHLNRLLSDPVAYTRFQALAPFDGKLTFVPLTLGFLCANLEIGNALLLLQEEWHTQGIYLAFSRLTHASMTAVNALMAYLAVYMAQRGDGVVAHGAGINFQGNGYLFLAPSGGGKTTLSMCSPPGSVLADDGIIIRESDDGYQLYPTPFRQSMVRKVVQRKWHRSAVKLQAAFMLEKSSLTCIKSAARFQTIGRLITAMTHFFMWMHPRQATQVFDFWRRLSIAVPMADLEWQLRSEFWTPIDNFLNKRIEHETQKEASKLAGNI